MDEYSVDVLPGEVLGWIREDAASKTPRLWVRASKEYRVETDFDRQDAAIGDDDLALVTAEGTLEISLQGGRHDWTLRLRAADSMALKPAGEEEEYDNVDDLSVDAFVSRFLVPEHGEVEVVALAEETTAWQRFQEWLVRRRRRQG